MKTGEPFAEVPAAVGLGENQPDQLGAFLGAVPGEPTDAPELARTDDLFPGLAEVAELIPDLDNVADLASLLTAWGDLPEPMKAGITAMVKAASGAE